MKELKIIILSYSFNIANIPKFIPTHLSLTDVNCSLKNTS